MSLSPPLPFAGDDLLSLSVPEEDRPHALSWSPCYIETAGSSFSQGWGKKCQTLLFHSFHHGEKTPKKKHQTHGSSQEHHASLEQMPKCDTACKSLKLKLRDDLNVWLKCPQRMEPRGHLIRSNPTLLNT